MKQMLSSSASKPPSHSWESTDSSIAASSIDEQGSKKTNNRSAKRNNSLSIDASIVASGIDEEDSKKIPNRAAKFNSMLSRDSSIVASSIDEQDKKTPNRAAKGNGTLSKWKKSLVTLQPLKIAATLQPLSFLSSRPSSAEIVDFDDGESLVNSILYLSLLLPNVEDYEDSDRSKNMARQRFCDTANYSLHLVCPTSSGLSDCEAIYIDGATVLSNEARQSIRIGDEWKAVSTGVSIDAEEVYFSDVVRNVHKILRIARNHVVAREFDEAAEVYSIILVNYQSRWKNIMEGKQKKTGKPRAQLEKTLKQWIGLMYHNMAVINNLLGNHEGAVRHAQDALRNRKELNELNKEQKDVPVSVSSTLHVINSLVELGLAHYGAGSFAESQEALSEALQVSYRLFPYYETTSTVAKICNVLGCVQFEVGQLVAALDSFGESLEVQRSLLGNREVSEDTDHKAEIDFALQHISTTLCNIGVVLWKRNCVGKALSMLEESLLFQESVLEDSVQPMFQRTVTLIKCLSSLPERAEEESNAIFLCGGNRFRCTGSINSASIYKRAISFVTAPQTSSKKESMGSRQCTISVHYVYHSIHMIYLSAPPCVVSAANKSNTSIVSGVEASQQKLKVSIEQCLQYCSRYLAEEDIGIYDLPHSFDEETVGCHPDLIDKVQWLPRSKSTLSVADMDMRRSVDPQPFEINFHLIHKYAIRCLAIENYNEAILLYHNILLTATSLSRKNNLNENYDAVSGMALHHLGVIFMYAESYQDAKTVFLKAIELRLEVCQRLELNSNSRSLTEDQVTAYYALSVSCANLALNCFLLSQYEDALVYFSKSLRFLRKLPSSPWIDAHISQVFNNIACVHFGIGESGLENSLAVLSAALSQCPPQNPQDHETEDLYTTLLINKGMAELHAKDYGLSLISFDEALRRLQRLGTTRLDGTDAIMEYMAYAMACNKCNGDDNGKKTKQLIRSYKGMLTNSSPADPKRPLQTTAIPDV